MGDQREGQREILHLHPVNSGHSLWIPSFAVLESDGVDAGQSKKPGSFHTSLLPLHGGLYLINSFHAFHGCFQVIKLTLESTSVTVVFLACRLKKASSGCAEVTLRTLYFFLVVRFYFFDTTLTNHIFSQLS